MEDDDLIILRGSQCPLWLSNKYEGWLPVFSNRPLLMDENNILSNRPLSMGELNIVQIPVKKQQSIDLNLLVRHLSVFAETGMKNFKPRSARRNTEF